MVLRFSVTVVLLELGIVSGLIFDYAPSKLEKRLIESFSMMDHAVMLNANNKLTYVSFKSKERTFGNLWPETPTFDQDVAVLLYNNKTKVDPARYELRTLSKLPLNKDFEPKKKTVILIHGYLNNSSSPMIQLNAESLMENQDVNILVVDWSIVMEKADYVYNWCAEDTYGVGQALGKAISSLIRDGLLHPSQIHIVGHSLGAHVAGVIGHYLRDNKQIIHRVTGLDPAKVAFEEVAYSRRIDPTVADYVDCIHSCGGYLGFEQPICQADFYPNGGNLQPGCSFLGDIGCVCSHGRSFRYFSESIIPGHNFPSRKCFWTADGLLGCAESPQLMGYPSQKKYQGTFFVKTQHEYPYSPDIKHPPKMNLLQLVLSWIARASIIIL